MFKFFGWKRVYICAQCGEVYNNNPLEQKCLNCPYSYATYIICRACGCEMGKPYREGNLNIIEAVAKRSLF